MWKSCAEIWGRFEKFLGNRIIIFDEILEKELEDSDIYKEGKKIHWNFE